MNNINQKNIIFKLKDDSKLPYSSGGHVEHVSIHEINSTVLNNSMQQLIDNDIYIENCLTQMKSYQEGPKKYDLTSLNSKPNGYKMFSDEQSSTDIGIQKKVEVPLKDSLIKTQNGSYKFIRNYNGMLIIGGPGITTKYSFNPESVSDWKEFNQNFKANNCRIIENHVFFTANDGLYEMDSSVSTLDNTQTTYIPVKLNKTTMENAIDVSYSKQQNKIMVVCQMNGTKQAFIGSYNINIITSESISFESLTFLKDDTLVSNIETNDQCAGTLNDENNSFIIGTKNGLYSQQTKNSLGDLTIIGFDREKVTVKFIDQIDDDLYIGTNYGLFKLNGTKFLKDNKYKIDNVDKFISYQNKVVALYGQTLYIMNKTTGDIINEMTLDNNLVDIVLCSSCIVAVYSDGVKYFSLDDNSTLFNDIDIDLNDNTIQSACALSQILYFNTEDRLYSYNFGISFQIEDKSKVNIRSFSDGINNFNSNDIVSVLSLNNQNIVVKTNSIMVVGTDIKLNISDYNIDCAEIIKINGQTLIVVCGTGSTDNQVRFYKYDQYAQNKITEYSRGSRLFSITQFDRDNGCVLENVKKIFVHNEYVFFYNEFNCNNVSKHILYYNQQSYDLKLKLYSIGEDLPDFISFSGNLYENFNGYFYKDERHRTFERIYNTTDNITDFKFFKPNNERNDILVASCRNNKLYVDSIALTSDYSELKPYDTICEKSEYSICDADQIELFNKIDSDDEIIAYVHDGKNLSEFSFEISSFNDDQYNSYNSCVRSGYYDSNIILQESSINSIRQENMEFNENIGTYEDLSDSIELNDEYFLDENNDVYRKYSFDTLFIASDNGIYSVIPQNNSFYDIEKIVKISNQPAKKIIYYKELLYIIDNNGKIRTSQCSFDVFKNPDQFIDFQDIDSVFNDAIQDIAVCNSNLYAYTGNNFRTNSLYLVSSNNLTLHKITDVSGILVDDKNSGKFYLDPYEGFEEKPEGYDSYSKYNFLVDLFNVYFNLNLNNNEILIFGKDLLKTSTQYSFFKESENNEYKFFNDDNTITLGTLKLINGHLYSYVKNEIYEYTNGNFEKLYEFEYPAQQILIRDLVIIDNILFVDINGIWKYIQLENISDGLILNSKLKTIQTSYFSSNSKICVYEIDNKSILFTKNRLLTTYYDLNTIYGQNTLRFIQMVSCDRKLFIYDSNIYMNRINGDRRYVDRYNINSRTLSEIQIIRPDDQSNIPDNFAVLKPQNEQIFMFFKETDDLYIAYNGDFNLTKFENVKINGITNLYKFGEYIYIMSSNGIYRWNGTFGNSNVLEFMSNTQNLNVKQLNNFDNELIINAQNGVYRYEDVSKTFINIIETCSVIETYEVVSNTKYSYVSRPTETGLNTIYIGTDLYSFEKLFEIENIEIGSVNDICVKTEKNICLVTDSGFYITKYGFSLVPDTNRFSQQDATNLYNELMNRSDGGIKTTVENLITNHEEESHSEESFISQLNNDYITTDFSGISKSWMKKEKDNDGNLNVANDIIKDIHFGTDSDETIFVKIKQPFEGSEYQTIEGINYITKKWNSGLVELYINIPTTKTYYFGDAYGAGNVFTNINTVSKRSNLRFLGNTESEVSINPAEMYNEIEVSILESTYHIDEILDVQINGMSLPLNIYKDAQTDNRFSGYILPSVVKEINIEDIDETDKCYHFKFACYGTDEQSIRIMFYNNVVDINHVTVRFDFNRPNSIYANKIQTQDFVINPNGTIQQNILNEQRLQYDQSEIMRIVGWSLVKHTDPQEDVPEDEMYISGQSFPKSTTLLDQNNEFNRRVTDEFQDGNTITLYAVWQRYKFNGSETTITLDYDSNNVIITDLDINQTTKLNDNFIIEFQD